MKFYHWNTCRTLFRTQNILLMLGDKPKWQNCESDALSVTLLGIWTCWGNLMVIYTYCVSSFFKVESQTDKLQCSVSFILLNTDKKKNKRLILQSKLISFCWWLSSLLFLWYDYKDLENRSHTSPTECAISALLVSQFCNMMTGVRCIIS